MKRLNITNSQRNPFAVYVQQRPLLAKFGSENPAPRQAPRCTKYNPLPAPLIQPIQAFIVQAGARQGRWLGRAFPVLTFNALLTMAKSKPKPKTQTYIVRASYEHISARRAKSAKSIIDDLEKQPTCVAGRADSQDGTDSETFNRP